MSWTSLEQGEKLEVNKNYRFQEVFIIIYVTLFLPRWGQHNRL